MNYYNEIKEKLINNEIYERVKDYSKERHKVITFLEIGKLLSEAGKEYGKNIIKQYAHKLMIEVGKKYNERTLYRMRKFYEIFNNKKLTPLVSKLNWSHCILLISIKSETEIIYYVTQIETRKLTKRELEQLIKSKEYERLPKETKQKLISEDKLDIQDLIPNLIVIKSKKNHEQISEKILQQIILEDIPSFLKELGSGFTFVENEYKIKIGNTYNYIDLLLFNYEYNCFVVIELKVTELKKEHIGQIEVYMNYIDKHLKKINQDKTIGIIICKKDNRYLIEYCSDPRIIYKEYKIV